MNCLLTKGYRLKIGADSKKPSLKRTWFSYVSTFNFHSMEISILSSKAELSGVFHREILKGIKVLKKWQPLQK